MYSSGEGGQSAMFQKQGKSMKHLNWPSPCISMKYLTCVGFLSYHSWCDTSFWWGAGSSRTLRIKKPRYPLIDTEGSDVASPAKPVPTAPRPPQPSLRWFRYSGRSAAPQPLPSIPCQPLEGCPSLMQMSQLGGFDCRSRGGGRGSSKVTRLVESWMRRLEKKKKMHGLLCSRALRS